MEKKIKFNEKPNVKKGDVGVCVYLSKIVIITDDNREKEFINDSVELTIDFINQCVEKTLNEFGYFNK